MTTEDTDLRSFEKFKMIENPPVESYVFRGETFEGRFNITLICGRIYLSGDYGSNVFLVYEDVEGLKKWMDRLDSIDYALGKGCKKKEWYEEEFARAYLEKYIKENAEQYIRDIVSNDDAIVEEKVNDKCEDVMDELEFGDKDVLFNSIRNNEFLNNGDYFQSYSSLLQWSPELKMQFKQLLFAGQWFRKHEKEEKK